MKWTRMVAALALVGAAACSSPTSPRLPTPEEGRDPPPDKPGLVARVAPAPSVTVGLIA